MSEKRAAFAPTAILERLESLKATISYQTRLSERLNGEIQVAEQSVDEQLELLETLNTMYQPNATLQNPKSPVFKALKGMDSYATNTKKQKVLEPLVSIESSTILQSLTDKITSQLPFIKDVDLFLREFPLVLYSLLPQGEVNVDIHKVVTAIEQLPNAQRKDFCNGLFRQLNDVSTIFQTILTFNAASSLLQLTELIEIQLSEVLRIKRSSFFLYKNNELILEKGKIQLKRPLSNGIIYSALQNGCIVSASKDTDSFSSEDEAILRQNKSMLLIPTENTITILFDKIRGFSPFDFLIATIIQKFIREVIPALIYKIPVSRDSSVALKLIHNFQPKGLAEFFQCKNARIFRISLKQHTFYDHHSPSTVQFLFNTGLVGQAITKKRPISMENPEFSILFHTSTDRYSSSEITESILISPILDSDGDVRWAVALYNRRELSCFTSEDTSILTMICHSMHPILHASRGSSKLTKHVERRAKTLQQLDNLTNLLTHNFLHSQNEISKAITKIVQCGLPDVYVVNNFRNAVEQVGDAFSELISEKSKFNVCVMAASGGTKQIGSESGSVVFSVMNGFDGKPAALLRIEVEEETDNRRSISSVYSSLSSFSQPSFLKNTKSNAQLKIEKLNSVLNANYIDVKDSSISHELKTMTRIIGPLLQSSELYQEEIYKIRYSSAVVAMPPGNLLVRAVEDLSSIIGFCKPLDDYFHFISNDINDENVTAEISSLYSSLTNCANMPVTPDLDNPFIVIPSDQFNADFNFDSYEESQEGVLSKLVEITTSANIENILVINRNTLINFIISIRALHSKNFAICLDRVQFAYSIIKSTNLSFSDEDIIALYLFLILRDIDKLDETGRRGEFIETGCSVSPSSLLLLAAARCGHSPLAETPPEVLKRLMETVNSFEVVDSFEVIAQPPLILVAAISLWAGFGRSVQSAERYLRHLYPELAKADRYRVEQEARTMLIPALQALNTPQVRVDTIRKRFFDNIAAITGTSI